MIWPTAVSKDGFCPRQQKNIFFFQFQQKIAKQFFVEIEKRK
jgi:hypothetical protein